jgi:predicted nucleic acid-binding protein
VVVVLDASIVFPLLIEEEKSLIAQEIYESSSQHLVLDFLHIEIANALASAIRQQRITASLATKAQMELAALLPITSMASHYLNAAFALALEIKHPIYDCLYAIAARENNATLVTCDTKFAAKLDRNVYRVQVI